MAESASNDTAAATAAAVIETMLPIRMISKVVRGFGRGSSDLGIPTANLDRNLFEMISSKHAPISDVTRKQAAENGTDPHHHPCFDDLPCGIYWGFCRIGVKPPAVGDDKNNSRDDAIGVVYKAAVSIGYNPTYGNEQKTVEPHLIAPSQDPRRHASSCGETVLQDFYDQPIRLSVVGYLRPELPFEGLEKLIQAIKQDIAKAEELGDQSEAVTISEKEWVSSEEGLK